MGAIDVRTRRFQADQVAFVVSCPTAAIRDTIEAAFVDLADDGDGEPLVIRLKRERDDSLSVVIDGQQIGFTAQSSNQTLGSVVTAVTRIALDADPERLHVHCAAVSNDGRGALISARSGTGKTTLAAKLLTRGWSYGSDESVAARLGSTAVATFPKPLMIKNGRNALFDDLRPLRVVLDVDDDRIWMVPASVIGAECVTKIEPRCVMILTSDQRVPGSAPGQPVPIHPTDAVVAMMGETMDAGRFGVRSVEVLAAIAASSHCVQMQVGPLDAAADALEELIAKTPALLPIQVLTSAPASGVPWHVAEYVRSVVIGDRVVIHDTRGGAITALDEAGTAVWRTLLGDPPAGMGPDVLHAPTMLGFVEQLIGLDLVHTSERHGNPA